MKRARKDEWDFPALLEAAAFDLRSVYEKTYGCNMGMDLGCSKHPKKCPHWPKVFAVWASRKGGLVARG